MSISGVHLFTDATMRNLLVRQDNVVALWQLTPALRRRVVRAAAGPLWQELTWQVMLAAPAPASDRQKMWAAVLHCGEHARLCGRAALQLHGWTGAANPPYDVLVPRVVRPVRNPQWLRLRSTTAEVAGPAAQPARTSADLAATHAAAWSVSDRQALFVVISTLQQRLTTPARVREIVLSRPKLPRRSLILEAIAAYENGAQSLNEFDFAAWCRRFGIIEPSRQTRLRDRTGKPRAIDVEFRTASGKRLRVEVEGLHHLDPAQYFADISRENDIAVVREGTSLRITTWHLQHEPLAFAEVLREALAR